jgi:hypothetical protein
VALRFGLPTLTIKLMFAISHDSPGFKFRQYVAGIVLAFIALVNNKRFCHCLTFQKDKKKASGTGGFRLALDLFKG